MLSDNFEELGLESGSSEERNEKRTSFAVVLSLEENPDALLQKAVEDNRAQLLRPPTDQFSGIRSGTFKDPFGVEWILTREIEKLEPAEMQRRLNQMMSAK